MQTVVITGSAKGFGYEMMKIFRKNDFNCVLCDVDETSLKEAKDTIEKMPYKGKVLSYKMDVTKLEDINSLIEKVLTETETIDIWINNAGVNQPDKYIWELDEHTINKLIDIDIKGVTLSSKAILEVMLKQGFGAIHNVEGHGSNDAKIPKLSLYGTSKRALTYFTESLSKEVEGKNICVGKITPGIMITNFLNHSLGDEDKLEIDDKTKKIYNILGDYPETIAEYIVPKIIRNKDNGVKFAWLTNRRAFARFMTYPFKKRNLFNNDK